MAGKYNKVFSWEPVLLLLKRVHKLKKTTQNQLYIVHTSLDGCAMVRMCNTFWGSNLGKMYDSNLRVCRITLVCDTKGRRNWSNTTSQKSGCVNSSCQAARELVRVWRETSSKARSWHVLTNQGKMATRVCLQSHGYNTHYRKIISFNHWWQTLWHGCLENWFAPCCEEQ